jgi:hypothetical protein
MSLLALLLAIQTHSPGAVQEPTQPMALLQAFRAFCLDSGSDRQAAALAAGFRSVPPTGSEVRETAAWEKDGIRLFEMSGQPDRYLLAPAFCGVSANVGSAGNEDALEASFTALPDYVFMEVTSHDGRTYWNLFLRHAGHVRVAFDRTQPANVRMTFVGTGSTP